MAVRWKENAVVNVKLSDSLYTLAQMYQDPFVQFFNISNTTGIWEEINLESVPTFALLPHDKFFGRECYIEKLNKVKPIKITPPKYIITTFPRAALFEPKVYKNGRYDPDKGKIIKDNLDPIEDEEIIRQYEMTGLHLRWTLKTRLMYFFETGEDIDLYKLNRFYPAEFIKYLEIFYEKFETDDIDTDAQLQAWKNYHNLSE